MKISLEIQITQNYQLNLYQINQQEEQTPIEFSLNESIDFIMNWLEKPEDYSLLNYQFQNTNYQVLPEVIFALIVYDIKKSIERNYIIENTIIELPRENKKILQRIKISLQAINLNGIQIDKNEIIEYDYTQQGEVSQRIIEKKEMYNEYQRMINRAFELQPTEEQKKKLEEMQKKVYSDETFDKEINNIKGIRRASQCYTLVLDTSRIVKYAYLII